MTQLCLDIFNLESDWELPSSLPDLSAAKIIGFDTETYDPQLKKQGPGFIRGDARVVGISLATELGHKLYLPIGHVYGNNLHKKTVVNYLREQLGRENQKKVGANVLYDLEALKVGLDVDVRGPVYDVLVAEPLLDENQRTYNLDRLGKHYLDRGKDYRLLEEAVLAHCGKKGDPRKDLWQLPANLVGPYAEEDALLPINIFRKQYGLLKKDGLLDIFELETKVTQVVFKMRLLGVPVDIPRAEETARKLLVTEQELQEEVNREGGRRDLNVWANQDIAVAFERQGIEFPRTPKGAPSFRQDWLENHPSKLAQLIVQKRRVNRIRNVFIQGTVIEHSVKGRVHCQFHQLRGDDGGAVSGRFASSNPNLQQIPNRSEDLAPLVRALFVPEEGCDWHCDDYSQIEPRLQVHYAELFKKKGAKQAGDRYRNNPETDFHQMTADLTNLPRKPAKTIHLGLSYGMGIAALAGNLGVSESEARELRSQYTEYMPFLDELSREINRSADAKGYITTILGRRNRFNLWEPPRNSINPDTGEPIRGLPLPRKEAVEEYGQVRRAYTHKAFNRLIQGSAADVIKKAMVDIYESGLLDTARLHLTVHDELDLSIPRDSPEIGREIVKVMENCVNCRVPLKVDNGVGKDWGDAE